MYDNTIFPKKCMTIPYFQRSVWQYHISKEVKHSNGLTQAKWHVLMRNKGLKIGLRLADNRPVFWGRVTGFGNNRNTTALINSNIFCLYFLNFFPMQVDVSLMFILGCVPIFVSFVIVALLTHFNDWDPAWVFIKKLTHCLHRIGCLFCAICTLCRRKTPHVR